MSRSIPDKRRRCLPAAWELTNENAERDLRCYRQRPCPKVKTPSHLNTMAAILAATNFV